MDLELFLPFFLHHHYITAYWVKNVFISYYIIFVSVFELEKNLPVIERKRLSNLFAIIIFFSFHDQTIMTSDQQHDKIKTLISNQIATQVEKYFSAIIF